MRVIKIQCGDAQPYEALIDRSFLCIRCGATVPVAGDPNHKVSKP